MKIPNLILVLLTFLVPAVTPAQPSPPSPRASGIWPSTPPRDIPFPPSQSITGIEILGIFASYGDADTWYPSWGADDVLYSAYADGGARDATGAHVASLSRGALNNTGRALIFGDDPLHLRVQALPVVTSYAVPYESRYPSANLMVHGVWYVGTYTLNDLEGDCGDWCVLGPFVGFHWSPDHGRTWYDPPTTPAHPLFGESALKGGPVKLSAAHFVDFGRDMVDSPDGKAYLVGHGASTPKAHENWIAGDQIYLARVKPTPESINDVRAWEFYSGRDQRGRPRWSKHFEDIQPLIDWPDHLGNVTITYDAPLKKYLAFITRGWPSVGPFDTLVLEADTLTSPWHLVSYLEHFGPQAYFVNVPSKFISADGRTMWLCYSANFAPDGLWEYGAGPPNPPEGPPPLFGSDVDQDFGMVLRKIRLVGPDSK